MLSGVLVGDEGGLHLSTADGGIEQQGHKQYEEKHKKKVMLPSHNSRDCQKSFLLVVLLLPLTATGDRCQNQ